MNTSSDNLRGGPIYTLFPETAFRICSFLQEPDQISLALTSHFWKAVSLGTASREKQALIGRFATWLRANLKQQSYEEQREQLYAVARDRGLLDALSFQAIQKIFRDLQEQIVNILKACRSTQLTLLEHASKNEQPLCFENICLLAILYQRKEQMEAIRDLSRRNKKISRLACNLITIGYKDKGLALVEPICRQNNCDIESITKSLAQKGHYKDAWDWLLKMRDEDGCDILSEILQQFFLDGTQEKAVKFAEASPTSDWRDEAFGEIAFRVADLVGFAAACRFLDRMEYPEKKSQLIFDFFEAVVLPGDFWEAIAILCTKPYANIAFLGISLSIVHQLRSGRTTMEDLLRILDRIEGDVEKWCAYQKIAYALVIKRLFAGVLVLFEQIDQSCRSQFIRELCAKLEDGSSVAFIEFIGFFKHELKAAAVDGLCEAMTSIANSGKIEIARRMISGFILDDERGSIIRTVVAGLVKEGSFYINPFIQCFTGRDRTYAVLGLYVA